MRDACIQSLGWGRGHVGVSLFVFFSLSLRSSLLASYFSRSSVHEVRFGGGARGDVCLNERDLRPVSGHPEHRNREQGPDLHIPK